MTKKKAKPTIRMKITPERKQEIAIEQQEHVRALDKRSLTAQLMGDPDPYYRAKRAEEDASRKVFEDVEE